MPYSLDFTLQGLPRLQTNNRGHWSARHKAHKLWHERVHAAVFCAGGPPDEPLDPADLQFDRFSTSEPDFDNLVASFKPIMDGLVRCGVIRDDKPSVIGSPTYGWGRAKRGEGHVRVRVWEGTNAN